MKAPKHIQIEYFRAVIGRGESVKSVAEKHGDSVSTVRRGVSIAAAAVDAYRDAIKRMDDQFRAYLNDDTLSGVEAAIKGAEAHGSLHAAQLLREKLVEIEGEDVGP